MASLISISLYTLAWVYALRSLSGKTIADNKKLLGVIALGLVAHLASVYFSLVQPEGLYFGFFEIASLFFLVINILVLASSTRLPLQNLFLLLLPLSVLSLVVSEYFDSPLTARILLTPGMITHILLSILAYSLLTIASIQALFLTYQNHRLKHRHIQKIIGFMPPLQTMETLLFYIVWAGFIFLTMSILTGAVFIEDILKQKLSHKTAFSIISWLIYAILLAGHWIYGWRGSIAARWVLGGFVALMLAYFGSKLVIEVIL